ncbi:hypothetical protein WN943_026926 [Citrus x changshan-huyou]
MSSRELQIQCPKFASFGADGVEYPVDGKLMVARRALSLQVKEDAEAKENTKPQEFTLHTQQRAVKRAMFNYSVATKLYLEQVQRKRVEKLQKINLTINGSERAKFPYGEQQLLELHF